MAVAAATAAAAPEQGATGVSVMVGGAVREALGAARGTVHMNQSSGGSGIVDGEGGRGVLREASPPWRSEAARGVVVLPHIARMSAFHSA